jgi:hypothetical protein
MFQVSSLRRDDFEALFQMDEASLAQRAMKRYVADKTPGFPCRVSLRDAEPGERVLLVPFSHQPAHTPYRASGPIFVRESAATASIGPDTVPALLLTRTLSVRAYDANHLMCTATVVDGRQLEALLREMLKRADVSYVHVHFAGPGCFACRVDRAA